MYKRQTEHHPSNFFCYLPVTLFFPFSSFRSLLFSPLFRGSSFCTHEHVVENLPQAQHSTAQHSAISPAQSTRRSERDNASKQIGLASATMSSSIQSAVKPCRMRLKSTIRQSAVKPCRMSLKSTMRPLLGCSCCCTYERFRFVVGKTARVVLKTKQWKSARLQHMCMQPLTKAA